jgi:phosphoglycolate phosphatase
MISHYAHLIFDFDGTLVDSAPAILESFHEVLAARSIAPQVKIDNRLIGPPLLQTLAMISGLSDDKLIQELADDFKHRYDISVARKTPLYLGIREAIECLTVKGCRLYIATNKRTRPTQLILDQLGLVSTFEAIYAIDHVDPPYANKAAMIAALLKERDISPQQACYIGDKSEDGQAADANDVDFFAVTWGYGEWDATDLPTHWCLLSSPEQLK